MTRMALLMTIGVCLAATPSLAVMTEGDCQALWQKADENGDGNVAGAEARIYIEAMTLMQMKIKDASGEKVDADEFLKACQQGAFDNIKT